MRTSLPTTQISYLCTVADSCADSCYYLENAVVSVAAKWRASRLLSVFVSVTQIDNVHYMGIVNKLEKYINRTKFMNCTYACPCKVCIDSFFIFV